MAKIAEKKPAYKSAVGRSMKKETADDKKKRRLNEDYKKRYFAFYDDVKISDRQDW